MNCLKILVVDDDSGYRQLVKHLLVECGVPVEIKEAEDGSKALDTWLWFQPDMLITDLQMPMCSGGELAMKVRDLEPGFPDRTAPTKLVLISADPLEAGQTLQAFDHVITKGDSEVYQQLRILCLDVFK